MDQIDYKQIAKNILKLCDLGANKKIIECYTKWELNQDMIFLWNYKSTCKAMELLGLPEPSEEEWTKR
jgi:hypothetical protein